MHSVGFTGTRKGMTERQRAQVIRFLRDNMPEEIHHGDCIGADAQFARLVWWQFRAITIVSHPPLDPTYRAYAPSNIIMPAQPYLKRDEAIVHDSDYLIATPRQHVKPKSLRGEGTWWTVDFATGRIPLSIFYPDGRFLSCA
jgi:hypothetical protein